jgi:prepilin signal peptidase PulO-like enzyme (type II secretory pathway)
VLSVFFFALGAISGSFAGVIAERSYTGQSWKAGRSRCNSCARLLTGADLVPVLSWLVSKGKCRTCGAGIPAGYLFIECTLALSFFFAYRMLGASPALVPFLLALVVLAAIVIYDLRHMVIPSAFSAWFTVFALIYAFLAYPSLPVFGLMLIIAGVIGLVLFLFYALSGGRVMGLGDTPVAFGLSLLTGLLAPSGLIYSFWIGAGIGIIVLFMRPRGHRMGIEVPFAPFLAAGFLLASFTGWNIFPLIGF